MKDYVFSSHCKDMLAERNISNNWVEETIINPDLVKENEDETQHFFRKISDYGDRVLHVVVNSNKKPQVIVTAFFDRKARRSL